MVNVWRFFAYVQDDGKVKLRLFLRKVEKTLIVFKKNPNIPWMVFSETVESFAILCVCTGRQKGKIRTFFEKRLFFSDRLPKKAE